MNRLKIINGIGITMVMLTLCCTTPKSKGTNTLPLPVSSSNDQDTATFGAGCFWCIETQFAMLKGVESVESGYSGGHIAHPTYSQVSRGNTGHAEVVNIVFNPQVISFDELLQVFFLLHDPTQLNRQGNDVGTQYRSAIFVHTQEQLTKSTHYIQKLRDANIYDKEIVTEVTPFTAFYKAEDHHQQYYLNNGEEPYCRIVITPKMEKFKKVFADKLKK